MRTTAEISRRKELREITATAKEQLFQSPEYKLGFQKKIQNIWIDSIILREILNRYTNLYDNRNIDAPWAANTLFMFTPHAFDPRKTATDFIARFYDEIKDILCNPKRKTEAATLSRQKLGPVCAGLSAFIAQSLAITQPIAIAVATYLLIVLLEASRGAFCKMSKRKIQEALSVPRG